MSSAVSSKRPSPSVARVPTLSMDEVALLLGLPAEDAERLARGDTFTGPSGLTCQLLMGEDLHGRSYARPLVMLQMRASDLFGDDVQHLLELQEKLLQDGPWFLGTSPTHELKLVSLQGHFSAKEVVFTLEAANALGLVVLRALLQMADPASGDAA